MREGVADFCYPFFVCFSFYVSSKQITFAATIQKKHTTMKKKILSAAFCLLATTAMGQINLVSYHPVPRQMNYTPLPQFGSNPFQMHISTPRVNTNTQPETRKPEQSFPVIHAYYVDSRHHRKHIKIKVNQVSICSFPAVFLRGVYEPDVNMWFDCNTMAAKVIASLDGEYMEDNFEWKAEHYKYGTIYFNY